MKPLILTLTLAVVVPVTADQNNIPVSINTNATFYGHFTVEIQYPYFNNQYNGSFTMAKLHWERVGWK